MFRLGPYPTYRLTTRLSGLERGDGRTIDDEGPLHLGRGLGARRPTRVIRGRGEGWASAVESADPNTEPRTRADARQVNSRQPGGGRRRMTERGGPPDGMDRFASRVNLRRGQVADIPLDFIVGVVLAGPAFARARGEESRRRLEIEPRGRNGERKDDPDPKEAPTVKVHGVYKVPERGIRAVALSLSTPRLEKRELAPHGSVPAPFD